MNGKILAKVVVEIVGSPKEHVEVTIRKYINNIKDTFDVKSHVLYDAEKLSNEKYKGMYSSFVDLEIEFKDFKEITKMCFDYMPSSIDIIKPDKSTVEAQDIMDMFNDLMAKLHDMDMKMKNINANNIVLRRELNKYNGN